MPEDEDVRFRLPLAFFLVVGVLAVIGLFSIAGAIVGFFFWIARVALVLVVAAVILYALKSVIFGRRERPSPNDV